MPSRELSAGMPQLCCELARTTLLRALHCRFRRARTSTQGRTAIFPVRFPTSGNIIGEPPKAGEGGVIAALGSVRFREGLMSAPVESSTVDRVVSSQSADRECLESIDYP
jgi:hypothetical protein